MAFIEELPSAEDIKYFDLPFWPDLEKPIEQRRTWIADRERDVYLTGVGIDGNPAFNYDAKMRAGFYLGRTRFNVFIEDYSISDDPKANSYSIYYPGLLEILVYSSSEKRMVDVLKVARLAPDKPHALLRNLTLNEFVSLFKEALKAYEAGSRNKYIQSPIYVTFGF